MPVLLGGSLPRCLIQAVEGPLLVPSYDRTALGLISVSEVEGIRYRVTTKTTRGVVGTGGWRFIGRGNEVEDVCVKALFEFAQHSGSRQGEYFFSVYRSKKLGGAMYHKTLRTVDSTVRLKAVGASMGIPPGRLSLKSLRKTYGTVFEATHLRRVAGG